MNRFRPDPWTAPDVYDWQTGGRQLSEEERKIARWLAKSSPVEKMDGRREAEKVEKEAA